MRELQDRIEHLQLESDCLQAQVEKRQDLGEKDVQDSGQEKHPITQNKGKEPIVPDNMDTPAGDELSSGSLQDLSLTKSSKARSR